MKSMTTSLLVFLLLGYVGLPQSVSSRNEISTTDSLPVIYIPGIMGSPMYNDVNNDDFELQYGDLIIGLNDTPNSIGITGNTAVIDVRQKINDDWRRNGA